MTPLPLARALVEALRPTGVVLEPASGSGNFVRALREHGCEVRWCEFDEGTDFLQWSVEVDEIIGNPPWSEFAAFLEHALRIARRRVAMLITLNHLWTRRRRAMVRAAGFGLERIIECDWPAEWGAPIGFQLGMAVFSRGWSGPIMTEALKTPGREEAVRGVVSSGGGVSVGACL